MNFGVSSGAIGEEYRLRQKDEAREGFVTLQSDPEQQQKYEEIISLLLAGGYFRARISTLNPFDKVAGGMAWCIRASNEDVDVNLAFQEGLRLGEKTHLSQNIEKALAKMKCPYNLQSQQLIFLDCIVLFPVVQWLVKKVMEVRHETADLLRTFSVSQFHKEHKITTKEDDEKRVKGGSFLKQTRKRYQTIKQYRIKRNNRIKYAEPMREHQVHYEQQKEEILELTTEASQKLQGQYQHKRALERYAKVKEQHLEKIQKIQPTYDRLQQQLQSLQKEYEEKVALNEKIKRKTAEMLSQETDENREDLAMLRSLVALNENLKQQVSMFKQNCKEQMNYWKQKILQAQSIESGESTEDETLSRIAIIEKTYEKDSNKLKAIQSLLATKIRAIALVKLKMDEVPSRRELQQYTKQFLELAEQMAVRFTETRRYVNTYNSLTDQLKFLESEIKILDFLQENYPSTIKSKSGKQKMLNYMMSVVESVQKNLEKANEIYTADAVKARELDELYSSLVEKERQYYRAAKEFQDECKRTEELQNELEKLKIEITKKYQQ